MASDNRITCLNLGSQHVTGAVFSMETGGGLALEKLERSELMGDPAADDRRAGQLKTALSEIRSGIADKGEKPRYAIPRQPVFIRSVTLPPLC